ISRAQELVAEDRLVLEHVAEILGAGEAERPILVERHVVEANFPPHGAAHLGRVLLALEVFARDADPLSHQARALAEDAERAAPDVPRADPGERDTAERQGERERLSTLVLPRARAKRDEVVPEERGQQVRRRHPLIGEEMVGRSLAVEVWHLELALEGREPIVAERDALARVLE